MEIKVTDKICSCCRGDLPLEDFYPSDTGMFGVSSDCRFCNRFKNHNRGRKKKDLPPFSIEEFRAYDSGKPNMRRKKDQYLKELAKKIEVLFAERRVKALSLYRSGLQ